MSEQSPMPAPPWPGLHSTPPGDLFENDDDLAELEFEVMAFAVPTTCGEIFDQDLKACNQKIRDALNAGWQIDEKIICPPVVWLILSREKEGATNVD